MILAISGTPGTGKTAVAKLLAKRLGANLISVSVLLGEIKSAWDKKRKTKIIDVNDVQKAVTKRVVKGKINIIDGHISHLIGSDVVVVLRCAPDKLMKRMKEKRWNRDKINENVQAEILDEITIEAAAKCRNVFEIDTTRKRPSSTAEIIAKLLNNRDTKKYRVGRIDWSEKYKKLLFSTEM